MINIQLHYIAFYANDNFFKAISKLKLLVDAAGFKEYNHGAHKVFLRVDKSVKINDKVVMFIEPQLNMSATCRNSFTPMYKLQLSVTNKLGTELNLKNYFELKSHFIEFTHDDFITYLGACKFWNEIIQEIFTNESTEQLSIPV